MEFQLNKLSDIPLVVPKFIAAIGENKKIAFHGEMGAGKTTFINGILSYLNIEDLGSSPTFSIVNEYLSPNVGLVYHFDFYRIENEFEAYDIGVEEMFYSDSYCFMEWPNKVDNLLPPETVNVYMSADGECRKIHVDL
jgi:tRNA threonylcarbamoyladenosine biosynthesis protein TsaE